MQSQWAEIVQAQITRVLDRVGGADRNRPHGIDGAMPTDNACVHGRSA